MRATRSRMAISMSIVCALEMRMVSIYSEAGGQLGRCDPHDSLRLPLANLAPFLGDIRYNFFAYSLDEGDAQPNGNL